MLQVNQARMVSRVSKSFTDVRARSVTVKVNCTLWRPQTLPVGAQVVGKFDGPLMDGGNGFTFGGPVVVRLEVVVGGLVVLVLVVVGVPVVDEGDGVGDGVAVAEVDGEGVSDGLAPAVSVGDGPPVGGGTV